MSRLLTLAFVVVFAATVSADKKKEPIVEIPSDKADKFDTKDEKVTVPTLVTTSGKDFETAIPDEATRKRIAKLVDFNEQMLLIFRWEGSGGDKLGFTIAESYPEQISFSLQPGRTRDLRPHVKVFVLRNNVKWSVK